MRLVVLMFVPKILSQVRYAVIRMSNWRLEAWSYIVLGHSAINFVLFYTIYEDKIIIEALEGLQDHI